MGQEDLSAPKRKNDFGKTVAAIVVASAIVAGYHFLPKAAQRIIDDARISIQLQQTFDSAASSDIKEVLTATQTKTSTVAAAAKIFLPAPIPDNRDSAPPNLTLVQARKGNPDAGSIIGHQIELLETRGVSNENIEKMLRISARERIIFKNFSTINSGEQMDNPSLSLSDYLMYERLKALCELASNDPFDSLLLTLLGKTRGDLQDFAIETVSYAERYQKGILKSTSASPMQIELKIKIVKEAYQISL